MVLNVFSMFYSLSIKLVKKDWKDGNLERERQVQLVSFDWSYLLLVICNWRTRMVRGPG